MKKLFFIALVASMAMLAACGSDSSSSPTGASGSGQLSSKSVAAFFPTGYKTEDVVAWFATDVQTVNEIRDRAHVAFSVGEKASCGLGEIRLIGNANHCTGRINCGECVWRINGAEQRDVSALAAAIDENPLVVQIRVESEDEPEGEKSVKRLIEAQIIWLEPTQSAAGSVVETAHPVFWREAEEIIFIRNCLHKLLMLKPVAAPTVAEEHRAGLVVEFVWSNDKDGYFFHVVFSTADGFKTQFKLFHLFLYPLGIA